jgi:hypothetical protein
VPYDQPFAEYKALDGDKGCQPNGDPVGIQGDEKQGIGPPAGRSAYPVPHWAPCSGLPYETNRLPERFYVRETE